MSNCENQTTTLSAAQTAGISFTRKQYAAVFAVFLIIIFLAFQIFLPERYKNDSYAHLETPASQIAESHLGGYRFIPAINLMLYAAANTNDVQAQSLNNICLLTSLALSATIVFLALLKKFGAVSISKLVLIAAGVTVLYVNTFIASLALFPETGMFMGFGYLSVTLAAVLLKEKPTVVNYVFSFTLLFAALGTYQALLGFYSFIAFSLLIAEHGLTFTRETFKRSMIIVSIMALASVANILVGKALCQIFDVAQNNRTAPVSAHLVLSNIVSLFKQQSRVWNGLLHTVPQLLGIFVCGILVLCTCGSFLARGRQNIRSNKLKTSQWIQNTLFSCFVFLFCYAAVFAPFLMASSAYLLGRGILSFFGVFLLLAVMLTQESNRVWINWLAAAAIGSLLVVCALGITRIGVEQRMTNALDREYALQISAQIKRYERETGTSVTKLSVMTDKEPIYEYDSVLQYCAPYATMMKSARGATWSQARFINVYTGLHLERVSMPDDIMKTHFDHKNWNYFIPEEQMFFVGDTVYIAFY